MAETVQNPALGPYLGQFNPRKLVMVAVAFLCLAFFGAIIFQSQSADYRLLFANMASEDGAGIVNWLKEQKIPYRLESDGTSIYVPADQLYEARLQLAGSGLAKGGGVGFEIFDKQSFGMTDFSQKVNYLRALQGELSRTIASLGPVKAARVHLVIPEKRVFQAQQQPATASVILKLAPGAELSESQILGIRNLVSGSIEGLAAEHVTVVDSSGRILTRPPRDENSGPATPGLLEYQVALEKQMEGRAQSLLDSALGPGNSVVRVTANVDFSQQEQTEERYDPDGSVIRSEQTSSDHNGGEVASGVPGVAANIKGGGKNSATAGSSHTEGMINYEVSKVVSRKVFPVGTVKNLSVAVLVADRRVAAGADGKAPEQPFTPRPAKELASLESMVKSALGVDPTRGDKFEISSLPFENAFELETPAEPSTMASKVYTYLPYVKYGLLTLAALMVYLLLVKPLLKAMGPGPERATTTPLKTVGQMEAEMAGGAAAEEPYSPYANSPDLGKRLREQVISQKAPSAQIIKSWLRE
ncbi:MAG: flagellar M-ring protein FliF [Desulfobulbaceae bacterium]|nr:flagellar M-ring protein FliF [Desulfobulbaceae bacterium]